MAGQTGAGRITVDVEGRELSLSNLDKQLYPAAGFRKADVVDYYRRVAAVMLPHLAGRPPATSASSPGRSTTPTARASCTAT